MVTRVRGVDRRGVSLTECLVGLVVLCLVGGCLLDLVSAGVEGTARAGEHQLASVVAARVVDRLQAAGYRGLVPRVGGERDLDLTKVGEPAEAAAPVPNVLVADGFMFSGRYRVDAVDQGLIRVTVTLSWKRYGRAGSQAPGSLTLVRFLADPAAGLSSREPFVGVRT